MSRRCILSSWIHKSEINNNNYVNMQLWIFMFFFVRSSKREKTYGFQIVSKLRMETFGWFLREEIANDLLPKYEYCVCMSKSVVHTCNSRMHPKLKKIVATMAQ